LMVYNRLGVQAEVRGDDVFVPSGQPLAVVPDVGDAIPKIDDAPWPGFPADMMSIAIVVATQANGTVLFHEKLFDGRLFFVDKLIGMGARIVLCDPHRCIVQGPNRLHAEPQGLCARGRSIIHNIGQIDRGYERIEQKLQALGARIERVSE
jgi:UDP-N-acetylglucosamine 1-carboxyvinyltransferase